MILPYAVPEKEGEKVLTPSMEAAAILCLAETKRKRRGLLRTTPEKISFISKLHYLLWLVPWDNKCLVFDGLGSLSANFNYAALPDLELFLDDIERGATMRVQYRNALEKHMQTFKDFAENVPILIEGLIADEELLSAVSGYVEETLTLKADVDRSMGLTPLRLDENAVSAGAKKVSDLYERVQSDIKGLQYTVQSLNEQAKVHGQMILREIELVREIHERELAKVKPDVDKKVERLMLERDIRIEKMNRAAAWELNAKLREKEKCERELERLELNVATYKKRLDTRRRRQDEVGVTRWEHATRMSQKKISDIKERIHILSHYIEKIREQKESDINKWRYTYQGLIDTERKKVTDIEASRDSTIEAKQKEAEKLRLLSSQIVNFIERLVEQKRLQVDKLKSGAISLQLEQNALVGVPLYLVAYQNHEKLQYHMFPPLRVMSSEGIVKKIENTIWSFRLASRIKLFMQPRSEALNRLFTIALERTTADKVLGESLRELCASNNILTKPNFKEELTKGIEELKTEGWIKQEERDSLMKTYLR
jgi:hypothetical protein